MVGREIDVAIMEVPRKLKIEILLHNLILCYDATIVLLGIYLEKTII